MAYARDMAELQQALAGKATRIVGEPRPAAAGLFPVPRPAPAPAKVDRYASKLEARYATTCLDVGRASGEIRHWWYEPFKLRLAAKCFYTPDFLLQYADDHLQVHEIKGFWRDDARVKIKVAAAMYPCFSFRAVRWVKGFWRYEDFERRFQPYEEASAPCIMPPPPPS